MWNWLSRAAVSSETADWLAECFSWAMQNFDVERFRAQTPLILPTVAFFPEQVSSQHGMAEYVLRRVVHFSGLQAWPWRLMAPQDFVAEIPPLLGLSAAVRGDDVSGLNLMRTQDAPPELLVSYSPEQTAKPQDLVATMAHGVAQHMLWQSQLTPPGGPDYFVQAAEVLAVFMGFGVMVTNSAYTFKGSCAKCYNPRADRQASLSESECLYALALFCNLQNLDRRQVAKHLKPYLAASFKSAERQISKHPGTHYLRELAV